MNSGELASIAGVTVRALRHYHQVGVLAEPVRSANGYRNYGVQHLITRLQIKRLAALGVPLERIPAALNAADDGHSEEDGHSEYDNHSELLDTLDRELRAQIDRLTAQRDLVAQMRSTRAAPDLPPELGPFLAAWARASPSKELTKIDRDQSILLAHLAGTEGMPHLVAIFERLSDPSLLAEMGILMARFDALGAVDVAGEASRASAGHTEADGLAAGGAESDGLAAGGAETDDLAARDAESNDLIEAFLTVIVPVVRDIREAGSPLDFSASAALFTEHTDQTLTASQRRVLAGVDERLEARLVE
jgi:DNA-binding transcriptional MerR regulator